MRVGENSEMKEATSDMLFQPPPHIGSGKEGYPRKPFKIVSRSIGPFLFSVCPQQD